MGNREVQATPSLVGVVELICTVENTYIHQSIQCDICDDSKSIVGTRFRCSTCSDFDVCSQCYLSGASIRHHPNHTFYRIQYRRLSVPPANGEDFDLLQRFGQGTDSESFYLHFPWFFGIPIFEKLIVGTAHEGSYRNMLTQLEGYMSGIELQIALDGVIRQFAAEEWNWRQVQDDIKPLFEIQLLRAQYSSSFHELYRRLERKGLVQGDPKDDAQDNVTLRRQLFSADLDKVAVGRCKDAAESFLATRTSCGIDPRAVVSDSTGKISKSARYIEMLSNGFDLNSAEVPILEEVETLLKRRKPGSLDLEWSISKSMNKWEEYTLAYKQIFTRIEQYFCDFADINCGGILKDTPIQNTQQSKSPDTVLTSFTRLTIRRDFKAATSMIQNLNHLNLYDLFKLIRLYELRGAVSDAHRVAQSASGLSRAPANDSKGFLSHELFQLCEAYFACFAEGKWTTALRAATSALNTLALASEKDLTWERCALEIYCYKIFLLAASDKGDILNQDFISNFATRLRQLRYFLTRIQAYDLALDSLEVELEAWKQEITVFELEQTEYLHHRRSCARQSRPVIESFADFLSTLTISAGCGGLNEYQNAEIEASARLLLGYALAKNQLEDPEIVSQGQMPYWSHKGPESDTMTENLNRAWELFGMCDSPLGQTEIAMLSMKYHVSLDNIIKPPEWEDIEACFKSMGYFRGLIKCAEYRADVEVNSTYNCTISPSLQPTGSSFYKRLLSIAKEAGDNLLFRICQVRSMPNWVESPTFIMICENVFHPKEGFLSDQLFLEASKLLGQLYEINNNFFESSAFAFLHLRISFARSDPLLIDYATMLYFRCVGNMASTIDDKDRIYEIACLVLSFDKVAARVCHSILGGIENCTPINPGGLPIESLLWPAEAVRHIVEDNGAQTMSPQVISAVYRSLKLAVDLLLLLPEAFHEIFFSKICHALGNAGRMIANPMLSLYGYELGRSRPNKFDGYHEAVLQLNIGRHLASWVHNDRPNFAGLQTLAFGYLDEALNFFWDEGARQSSYKNGLEASLVLARAHLGEVQCLSEGLDCGEDTVSEDNVMTTEQETNKQRLLDHVEAGLLVIRKAVSRNLTLRRRLSGLPPMQALENSRLLYFGDMEELYWNEVGLEMERSRLTGDLRSCLVAIQKWKAASLQDIISQRLEPAVRAPNKIVLEDIGSTEATFPSVLSLGDELPIFEEESIWAMAELAEAHIDEGRSVIFVDWVRCYDALCIIAYNGTEGRIKKAPVELEYHKIEEWVQSELGVLSLHQGRTDRQRLQKYSRLRELMPILEALQGFVKPNDLLVLCPSGILHAVPLQAIPFGPKKRPLIVSNPVVFCQSFSLLKTCVNNVENSLVLSSIPAAAFTRIGSDDVQEASRMHETARDGLANKSFQACVLSEKEVTRAAFMSQARGVRLLHYHGHAYLEADQRRDRALRLEPQSTLTESPLDDGLLSVMDIFELRLNTALVVLMACASGEDDIAPNDDPLGLLSAFLYAGASSIICTRWPTQTSDAREFAKRFYNHAFRGRKNGVVNIAAAVQAATIELWELWDEDYPYHWAQFQLHGSWFGKI